MKYLFIGLLGMIVWACSTEKNTLLNRSYHGLTAHYNGYFNANELINQSVSTYRSSLKEDYYQLLPIRPLPNEEEVKSWYPAIDTAIAKCTKVISKHSMPTASEPSKKKAEFNKWIDENWLTIGISNFYRRDYEAAIKNFNYIRKFFVNNSSRYTATVWMINAHLKNNQMTEASILIQELEKDLVELKDQEAAKKKWFGKKEKGSKKKKKKNKKKSKKEEEKAPFTKKTRYLFELTKAEYQLMQEEYDKAIESLEASLKFVKKSADKARVHFILGQLYAQQNNNNEAVKHFGKVLKFNAPFEMLFSARLNRAMLGGGDKLKRELEKMLKDEKNLDFKDQIYFVLAEIEFKSGNVPKGKEYLHKSILYSINNNRQKAMAYEKLGDMSFTDRDYVTAQKYYDSCATVVPDTYANADVIRNKAARLKDLVKAVETAQYEDSVQRIASMPESERIAYVEKLTERIKKEREEKKRQEEEKLKILQAQQMALQEQQSTTKFFWNNSKIKTEGLETFRKQWGSRNNEDDWRRSEKIVLASITPEESDTLEVEENKEKPAEDSLSPEILLAQLPVGDSAMSASMQRLLNAYYDAGMIYKEQLNERDMAIKQFEAILARNVKGNQHLLALYQLYRTYENLDPSKAYSFKEVLLREYPESDFANYLRDPDYFVKQKELEKLNEEDYVKVLDRYNGGLYSYVAMTSQRIVEQEKNNKYRSKYYLLYALATGQMSNDKKNMLPILEQILTEYPGTPEEQRAKELIGLINKGPSKTAPNTPERKSLYEYEDEAKHFVIIFLDRDENVSLAKSKLSDFSKEFYGREKLEISSKVFGTEQSIVLVQEMGIYTATDFISTVRKTNKYVKSMQGHKMYAITQKNMKTLFETGNLDEYDLFYTEFY